MFIQVSKAYISNLYVIIFLPEILPGFHFIFRIFNKKLKLKHTKESSLFIISTINFKTQKIWQLLNFWSEIPKHHRNNYYLLRQFAYLEIEFIVEKMSCLNDSPGLDYSASVSGKETIRWWISGGSFPSSLHV